jgi:hypothetical protein
MIEKEEGATSRIQKRVYGEREIPKEQRLSVKEFSYLDRQWWLTLVILTNLEAEIGRITVHDHPRQIVCETISP